MNGLLLPKEEILVFQPFRDNAEFLDAKLNEISLLLELTCLQFTQVLNLKTGLNDVNNGNGNCSVSPDNSDDKNSNNTYNKQDNYEMLNNITNRNKKIKSQNSNRLKVSNADIIPFKNMVSRCNLSVFEQNVILLLFFKSLSPKVREQIDYFRANGFTVGNKDEMTIGLLLHILCPDSFLKQLEARKYFSVNSPLVTHNLVQFGRNADDCASFLDVEIYLPQRVINWISDDQNIYSYDMPFIVENPKDSLNNVVLPYQYVKQVVSIIENYDEYLRKKISLE